MAPFDRKLTPEHRQAIYRARYDHNWSYREIHEKANNGQLVPGQKIDVSLDYVGRLCREELDRRNLKFKSPLADKPHRDAIEELRRALVSAAADMLADYATTAKKHPDRADPGRGREIARLIREAAAIPAQKEDTPAKPGASQPGTGRTEGQTRNRTAGQLLTAMRQHTTPATETEPNQDHEPTSQDHAAGSASGSLTNVA